MADVAKTRLPPEVVPFGKREIISTGQFNLMLVAEKMIREGINEWVSVSDLAKFVYHRSFLANNKRVRSNLWQLRRELLRRGFLLISDERPVEHVKIYAGGELENQHASAILQKMRTRSDISSELYERAVSLVTFQPRDETAPGLAPRA
jgi:hypothetical protein